MRISDNANFGLIRDQLAKNKEKMDKLVIQSATLKKIHQPEDDPASTVKILQSKGMIMNQQQYLKNAQVAESMLKMTDHALQDLTEILMRTKEIALSFSSDASLSEQARRGVAAEVESLWQSCLALSNQCLGDRYLFSGEKSTIPAFTEKGIYCGDAQSSLIEISKNVYMRSNLPGSEVFMYQNENKDPVEINLFEELYRLKTALLSGSADYIRGSLDSWDQFLSNVISQRAKIGSRLSSLSSNIRALDKQIETSSSLISQLEDADVAQTLSDLSKQEAIYKNALASSKKLIHPTLMDYLQ